MYPLNIHQALAIEEVYLRVRRDYRDPFSEWTTRRVESIAPLETVHDPNGWWHLVFADDLPLPILLTPAWAHYTRVETPSPEERALYRRQHEVSRYSLPC
ncbi:hypothetical protein [Actinopolyspora halophila]|uniref:hypothetical protein n=1 Tax=Actinopolyspora halophila TaxID=1850 RepID=UPI00036128BE|nr:hypothetical protein [Actinopolyspora halophila]